MYCVIKAAAEALPLVRLTETIVCCGVVGFLNINFNNPEILTSDSIKFRLQIKETLAILIPLIPLMLMLNP